MWKLGAGAGGVVSFSSANWSARFALSRPPVTVKKNPPLSSLLNNNGARSFCRLIPGFAARTSAAVPLTCGVDIDVPLAFEYVEPSGSSSDETIPSPVYPRGVVLKILSPGAVRWTVWLPKLEKDDEKKPC